MRADVPGLGKKWDKATAHYDYTIVEDGAALIGKSYWPEGTHTEFIAYDKGKMQIHGLGSSPIFGTAPTTIHYRDKKWFMEGRSTNADGVLIGFTVAGTFSDDGNTLTVTEILTEGGEKSEFLDVWHRVNK